MRGLFRLLLTGAVAGLLLYLWLGEYRREQSRAERIGNPLVVILDRIARRADLGKPLFAPRSFRTAWL